MVAAASWLVCLNLAGRALAATAGTDAALPAQTSAPPYRSAEVMALAEKVAVHQIAVLAGGAIPNKASPDTPHKTGWVQGALFVGLTEMAERSGSPLYQQTILARGEANKWQLGPMAYHADDHVIGQTYLWAARHGAPPEALTHLKKRFDTILAFPPEVGLKHREYSDPRGVDCDERWCWSDALFMAPAAWLELSKVTGDPKYAAYAKKEFLATTDYLYDPQERLFFRDSRFFDRRGPNGEKVFWSRGNGWVFAGLPRMIPLLPPGDPVRARMEQVFKAMAAKLKVIQKPDGYWSPSLLSDPTKSLPESSGTGFFTYGFAWGIKAGLLDAKTYEPVVRKGWAALARSVHPSGRVGWVQPVSDRPEAVAFDDTQFYGVGAFLLAATAVADLDLAPGPDLTVQSVPVPVQAVLNVQDGGTLINKVWAGGVFHLRQSYSVPASHTVHDGLLAFEGVGWESDQVAYRLYLDERLAIDIFGKKVPGPVLHTIGQGVDDYHAMAPWGMDIFKVGDTVGVGGIGLLRRGQATQLGPSRLAAKVLDSGPQAAVVEVSSAGFDGEASRLTARFDIRKGSALTRVTASSEGASSPLVTGLAKHPDVTWLRGEADGSTGWAYLASWGVQSLAKDALGLVVFYKPSSVVGGVQDDGSTLFVSFSNTPRAIQYAFASAWAQDQQGVRTLDAFKTWIDARRAELGP
ncbi:glycosyl hydrolase family 88 [Pelomonas sp. HMWF004]|nr:glycosyl hydrolase family 88 [Pelomonas sp. HMWF004]